MSSRCMAYYFCLFCVIMGLTATSLAAASGSRGQVTFQGLPVPGATVTAIQGDRKFTAITNREGLYSFPDLTGGTWTIEVEMTGFSTLQREIVIAPNAHGEKWELKLLPLDQIKVASKSVPGSIQSDVLGINTNVNWWHRITPQLYMNSGYQYNRLRTRVTAIL